VKEHQNRNSDLGTRRKQQYWYSEAVRSRGRRRKEGRGKEEGGRYMEDKNGSNECVTSKGE
jgi:hypothetical protein